MTISDKIYRYMQIKHIGVQNLAEILEMNRTTLSAMLNGRNRFSQDFFEALHVKCPEIDINKLLDSEITDNSFLINNDDEKTPDHKKIESLEKTIREIKKIVSKVQI